MNFTVINHPTDLFELNSKPISLLILNSCSIYYKALQSLPLESIEVMFLDFKINMHFLNRNLDGYFNNV